ncbi:hypothetical protein [Hyalangium gracile]|uniref:hypothetical protein n=1 Tax=Hyalangium gracile TaxID=394092 RepID=UPI001CC96D70|nr:hypothetical protein [Hyalangium gracile]
MTCRLRLPFLTLSALLTLSAGCGSPSSVEPAQARGPEGALPSEVERVIQSLSEVSSSIQVNPSPASGETQQRPAVAQGQGVYLVVWEVSSTATGSSPDIVGVRVRASDGALLDSSPLPIATGASSQTEPAVAFDGTHFLVVWAESGGAPSIQGRRVNASDGSLVDSTSFRASISSFPADYDRAYTTPSVACNGTNCLVSWSYAWSPAPGYLFNQLSGTFLRASDVTHLDMWPLSFSYSPSTAARVAFSNGYYMATWVEGSNLKALGINARTRGHSSPVTVSTSADQQVPDVAGQGGEFLVTWLEAGNVWARRVKYNHTLLGSANTQVGTNALAPPSVTVDGADYRVLWNSPRNGVTRALSTRVSALAELAPNAELGLSEASSARGAIAAMDSGRYLAAYATDAATVGPRVSARLVTEGRVHVSPERMADPLVPSTVPHYMPTVGAGNGVYLMAWSHPVSGGGFILQGLRVSASTGQVLDSVPLTINSSSGPNFDPAVAFDGTNFLVVWVSYNSTPTIYGARVRASDGAVLDSTPFRISTLPAGAPSVPHEEPALAFDGTNYLVTWQGYGYDANGAFVSGVYGIRVSSYATLVDSSSFLLAQGGQNSRVAYSDGKYLVTWERNQNIEAARINASTRQVLDSPAISLAASPGNERLPAVAGEGGRFLVTWIGGDDNLWARRVSGLDGALLDSGDISVGPAAVMGPEVTFDGRDYWIGWQGTRGGVRKVLGTRVTALGTLEADSEVALSTVDPATNNGSYPQVRGGIAAAGPGHILSTYLQDDPSISTSLSTFYSSPRFQLVSASLGSALPLVSEARASWAGCDYAIQARRDVVNEPYPYPHQVTLYRLFAQVSADASGTCAAAPTSTALGESETVPVLAIVANGAGVAVGYSEEFSYRWVGSLSSGFVAQLNPSTLGIVRRLELDAGSLPPSCAAGGPGSLSVGQISLTNGSDLVVEGPMGGNTITLSGLGAGVDTSTPCDGSTARATTFTATIPGFLTSPQAPTIVIH